MAAPVRFSPFSFASPATPAGKTWLLTFTDLVCLLLTFFVMLYAMSEPDPARYKALAAGAPGAKLDQQGDARPEAAFSAASLDRGKAIELGYLGRVFESQMAANPELADVTIRRVEGTLILSLPSDLLFAPGDATLSEKGRAALFTMGGVAANIGNAVDVVGHADASPAGPNWASNWELSLARARTVADALHEAGYLRDITVRGHGDGQSGGAVSEAARRVDLVVREHGGAP
ncbi:OmpA/MotB family protein [Niveispirillum sp. KHB5.9]|uniref:OmpA/MotB family protein n=1 Tax=Niveispirillum sp. KHB5.9 TaxID=3400269 RepID=UPI003A89173D